MDEDHLPRFAPAFLPTCPWCGKCGTYEMELDEYFQEVKIECQDCDLNQEARSVVRDVEATSPNTGFKVTFRKGYFFMKTDYLNSLNKIHLHEGIVLFYVRRGPKRN